MFVSYFTLTAQAKISQDWGKKFPESTLAKSKDKTLLKRFATVEVGAFHNVSIGRYILFRLTPTAGCGRSSKMPFTESVDNWRKSSHRLGIFLKLINWLLN